MKAYEAHELHHEQLRLPRLIRKLLRLKVACKSLQYRKLRVYVHVLVLFELFFVSCWDVLRVEEEDEVVRAQI